MDGVLKKLKLFTYNTTIALITEKKLHPFKSGAHKKH